MSGRAILAERAPLAGSLWTATAADLPDCPPLRGRARADVAVVGAGYTGLSAAIHLAERGVGVVVLEAAHPGWGASGRNGGQVIPGLKEDPDTIEQLFGPEVGSRMVAFAGAAPDVVFDLIGRHGIDCDAERAGWIQPAHDDATRGTLERRVAQWAARGAPVELIDADATARLIGSPVYREAALDRRGGAVHPLKYALGLAAAASRLGVSIHGDSRVTAIERADGRLLLKTGAGEVSVEQALVCTNGYSGPLHHGLRRSVVPVCSVQVATEPLSGNVRATIFPEHHVASDMRRLLVYYRLTREGRLVMGGRGAYGDNGIRRQMDRLRSLAAAMFPQVGRVEWPFHWGGFVAMTADHFPHLNEIEPGITAALGYNGRGVAMASSMGRVLADRAAGSGEDRLAFPMTPLRPIPFHGLRWPAVAAFVGWNGLRDRIDARRAGATGAGAAGRRTRRRSM
jgi:glycine/D-amino acid oxidase-like deaminating enzyme